MSRISGLVGSMGLLTKGTSRSLHDLWVDGGRLDFRGAPADGNHSKYYGTLFLPSGTLGHYKYVRVTGVYRTAQNANVCRVHLGDDFIDARHKKYLDNLIEHPIDLNKFDYRLRGV